MSKLKIDHERSSSSEVDYGDLIYLMEKINQLIERIEELEGYVRRIAPE